MLECKHSNSCNGCTLNISYDEQLSKKLDDVKRVLNISYIKSSNIFKSDDKHFRDRVEFKLYHNGDKISYAMYDKDKKPLPIDNCLIVNNSIYNLLPKLLIELKNISYKCFRVDFLTNGNKVLVDLIYNKRPTDDIIKKTEIISKKLNLGINIVSKKFSKNFNYSYIEKKINIGSSFYRFNYSSKIFTQPNGKINEQLLNYVYQNTKNYNGDLLELYTGIGNFSLILSKNFDNIIATEVNKESIKVARINAKNNNIDNIKFLRLSSEEFKLAYFNKREFRRVKEQDIDLLSYDINTVLVDPPRSGIGSNNIELLKEFKNIIYISCNYNSLKDDLDLLNGYNIEKIAFFDQFAYTNHIETVVILQKRD